MTAALDDSLLNYLIGRLQKLYVDKQTFYFRITTQYANKTGQLENYTGDFSAYFDGRSMLIRSYKYNSCINISLNYEGNGNFRWDGNILANSPAKGCFTPTIIKGNADILTVLKAKFAECIIKATGINSNYQIADEATLPGAELELSIFNLTRGKEPLYQKYGFVSDFAEYDRLADTFKNLQFSELDESQQQMLNQRFSQKYGLIAPTTSVLEILRAIPIDDPLEKKNNGLGQPLSKDIFLDIFNNDDYEFSQYHEPGQDNSPFTFNFEGFRDNWQNKVLVTNLTIYETTNENSVSYQGTYQNPQPGGITRGFSAGSSAGRFNSNSENNNSEFSRQRNRKSRYRSKCGMLARKTRKHKRSHK
jgi:hypothetical protein